LRRSKYDRKKIQSSVRCYAIPITTGKKKDTVVWPSFVAPFQSPLLRHSNYDRKKRNSPLTVVTPFQLRPEKKDTVVWPSFVVPFQLQLLRCSNHNRKKRYSPLSIVTPFQIRPKKKTTTWKNYLSGGNNGVVRPGRCGAQSAVLGPEGCEMKFSIKY
jgi:hypothetical protein